MSEMQGLNLINLSFVFMERDGIKMQGLNLINPSAELKENVSPLHFLSEPHVMTCR